MQREALKWPNLPTPPKLSHLNLASAGLGQPRTRAPLLSARQRKRPGSSTSSDFYEGSQILGERFCLLMQILQITYLNNVVMPDEDDEDDQDDNSGSGSGEDEDEGENEEEEEDSE